jgi:Type IV secretion system pilin
MCITLGEVALTLVWEYTKCMHIPFISTAHAQDLHILPITGGPTDSAGILTHVGNNILSILLLLGGIAAVFYLIYAGWLYISSAGNPEVAKKARAGVFNAVIGIIIITSAFFIVRLSVFAGNALK